MFTLTTKNDTLSASDYQILNYINKNGPISKEKLTRRFAKVEALDFRLEKLKEKDYQYHGRHPEQIPGSSYIEEETERSLGESNRPIIKYLGIYMLTDFGRVALQDYRIKNKIDLKMMWVKHAWIPILVSLATNLAINEMRQSLLWSLGWLASFLSKILS